MIKCSICKGDFDGKDQLTEHFIQQHGMNDISNVIHYLAFLEERIQKLEGTKQ
jgi:hypothetical protein